MPTNRVFITGFSALTACGTADETWNKILAGEHGLADIQEWDISSWPVTIGGELKNFQPAKMLPDRKLMKVISPYDAMGIHVALQAVEQSGMIDYRNTLETTDEFNEQTAVFVGSPGNKYLQQYDFLPLLAKTTHLQEFAEQLSSEVHPMWLLRILPNNVLAYTGITYGFKGQNHNITNHAAGGAQAIIEAYHAIIQGQADRAVVIAYDMGIEPQALYYYEKLGVLSAKHLKPFDKGHDGTVLANGAAAIVLESEASALARKATCYAECLGGMARTEAKGLFSLNKDGQALGDLLEATLAQHNLNGWDINCIVAHGNGNKASDESEARAIDRVFGNQQPPVTAFKWSTGHTLCASGLIDTVLTTYALRQRCAPGIANFNEAASECQNLNLASTHRPLTQGNHAMLINRGFASMNACLLFKACEPIERTN